MFVVFRSKYFYFFHFPKMMWVDLNVCLLPSVKHNSVIKALKIGFTGLRGSELKGSAVTLMEYS